MPFKVIKTTSLKSRKIAIFAKGVNPWVWSIIGHFSIFLFLSIIGQQNVFYDILERKSAFLGYKTACSKSGKIEIFAKGLTHGFCPELAIFPSVFFLGNIGQQNVFYDILERKNAFHGYKNSKLKN